MGGDGAVKAAGAADAGRERTRAAGSGGVWGIYFAFAIALSPVVMPIGTLQLEVVDAFNVLALATFAVLVLTRQIELRAPFAAGVFVVLVGSLVAMVNAQSVPAAVLALTQDAYLYLWFIMLVSVMRLRGELVALRIGWVAVSCVVAIIGFADIMGSGNTTLTGIVGPKGERATATFPDPNMCADYLGMSFFLLLSLGNHVGRAWRWIASAILLAAIVATKSNGGALSLMVGLVVWTIVRGRTTRFPLPALTGVTLFVVSLVLAGWWMASGLGVGTRQLENLEKHSFLARAEHSSQGRFKIWRQLEATLQKAPLGIGPGNSAWMPVTVEGRERPHSMYSKEAHSDYLAYMIERGPLGILALLFVLGQTFGMVRTIWKRRLRAGQADPATGALVAGLAGALACSAVHSLTIERLHFRHFWLLLAIVCALADTARIRRVANAVVEAPARGEAPEPLAVARA
jgi:O-antigen ligase/polysaccharide polymerase Wzy-like membrane protein